LILDYFLFYPESKITDEEWRLC